MGLSKEILTVKCGKKTTQNKQTKKNRDIKDITEIFAKRLYHLLIRFDVVRQ